MKEETNQDKQHEKTERGVNPLSIDKIPILVIYASYFDNDIQQT